MLYREHDFLENSLIYDKSTTLATDKTLIQPYIPKIKTGPLQMFSFASSNMTMFNRISNYWLCQIAGWSFVGLSYVFFAYTFGMKITPVFISPDNAGGFCGYHDYPFVRWVIQQLNWLLAAH